MEKYNSKYTSIPLTEDIGRTSPDNFCVVHYPHIIFGKEDGKVGMKVSLKEIVDVWLETLEPEQQSELELEETTRQELKELASKNIEENNEKLDEVDKQLKLFMSKCIVRLFWNNNEKLNARNVRRKIHYSWDGSDCGGNVPHYDCSNLLSIEEWDAFRERCNKIFMYDHPDGKIGVFEDFNTEHLKSSPMMNVPTGENIFWRVLKELEEEDTAYWNEMDDLMKSLQPNNS